MILERSEFAKKLGIKMPVNVKPEVQDALIEEAIDDLNTWLLAKANVKKDLKVMNSEGSNDGLYAGKNPITGEKVYK